MEKADLAGYVEVFAHLEDYPLRVEFAQLCQAAADSQVHTFGWPVGLVMQTEELRPKPYDSNGIRAVIERPDSFDFWTLQKNGDYYILMSLFEDMRTKNQIFIDTRTVRTTEIFMRTAQLYKRLGVPGSTVLTCQIEHGGLLNRKLTAANPLRAFSFHNRISSVNVVNNAFSESVDNYLDTERLKEMVFEVVKTVTEVFDMFVPDKIKVTDPMVEAFLQNKIV